MVKQYTLKQETVVYLVPVTVVCQKVGLNISYRTSEVKSQTKLNISRTIQWVWKVRCLKLYAVYCDAKQVTTSHRSPFTLPNGLHRLSIMDNVSPSRRRAGTGTTYISRPLMSSISNRWVRSNNHFGKQTVKQYEYMEKTV